MSNFNFTNVEINSGRKQIIDIVADKKVIDDRIERSLIVMKKAAIVTCLGIFFELRLNGRASFLKK